MSFLYRKDDKNSINLKNNFWNTFIEVNERKVAFNYYKYGYFLHAQ